MLNKVWGFIKQKICKKPKQNNKSKKEFFLSEKSLEWSKNHIKRFSDGDIFPKPFEFNSIWSQWEKTKLEISKINLYQYDTSELRIMAVPKSSLGFRISHQLHPIDTIIYFALIYYIVNQLEKYRFNYKDGISCSYRFKLDNNGNLFDKSLQVGSWQTFENKTEEYANKYEFILITDITDFYNSIYIHRVQNIICDAFKYFNEDTKESYDVSNVIEKFLMSLTAKASKGIPVGPTPSIVLSEFILTDIDYFLKNNNVVFTRYADDFRIFTNCKYEANKILQKLTKYLYSVHKLSLSSSKTSFLPTQQFIEENLTPEKSEQSKKEVWHSLLGDIFNPYGHTEEEIEEELAKNKVYIDKLTFNEMLDYLIETKEKNKFDLGLARHLLGTSKFLKNDDITLKILNNLELFLPVIKEVSLYFIKSINKEFAISNEGLLVEQLNKLRRYNLPFVDLWIDYLIIKNPFIRELDWKDTVFTSRCSLQTKRKLFIAALLNKDFSCIRQYKETYISLKPWDKRAFIYACQILPIEERVFLESLNSQDLLDNTLIKHIRKKSSFKKEEVLQEK